MKNEYHLNLFQTLYTPSISHNFVSVSKLNQAGYSVHHGDGCFNLFLNSNHIGSGILIDGLYKFHLDSQFAETHLTLHSNVETKCKLSKNDSYFLWHKRLGHISSERIKRLVKDGILPSFDFTNHQVFVDCI